MTTTKLPTQLIDNTLFNKLEVSNLQATEREIIAIYLMVNKLGRSAQGRINELVATGKSGFEKIITIANWLKTQGQDTATLKTQVNRAMTKQGTGLSLQGLGKGQKPIIAPKKDQKGGKGNGKGSDDVLTIQYDNDSFDQQAFDQMFNEWDKQTQQYFIKHLTKLGKK